jgi:tRNA uracil 4-sulfurtransferase
MEYNSIILRYGEIGLKSERSRKFFEKIYTQTIEEALKKHNFSHFRIIPYGKRFTIHINQAQDCLDLLSRIPGIQSLSPSFYFEFKDEEDLKNQILNFCKPLIEDKTFRVTIKRVGNHDFSSMQLSADLGEILLPFSKGVSMREADINLHLEIRRNLVYIYTKSITCVGGLPPTSAGRVLSLFSGGIDSPVAVYEMLKRGCAVDFIYINMLGDAPFDEIAKVYNHLFQNYIFGYVPKFYVVDAFDLVNEIKDKVDSSLRQILLKIIFYKISTIIAKKNKHLALITGEALSQKSSQTLQSLSVINSQTDVLVLRPLIGLDKIEIIKIARELKTFELSEHVKEYCSLSDGPVTTNPPKSVLNKFPNLDELIQKSCKEVLIFRGEIELSKENNQNQNISKETAIIVDIREENKRQLEKINSNITYEYPEIFHHFDEFDKTKKYIILCDHGLRSFDVANKLNKEGFIAKSVSLKQFLGENIPSCSK